MSTYKTKKEKRWRRHKSLRKKIMGTAESPRLSVFPSSKHFYAQFIDDESMTTLTSVSTMDKEIAGKNIKATVEGIKELGQIAADRAKEAGIDAVVFDRGGFKYHGKIKAFADAVRDGGITF
jgi:large subunit ribosomal protein L18